MIGLLQRVTEASVSLEGNIIAEIGRGLLVLVAVHRDDTLTDVSRLAERVLTYRVFSNSEGHMSHSLIDEGLALLAVPQFTLTRLPDVQPNPAWSEGPPEQMSIHMTDQVPNP